MQKKIINNLVLTKTFPDEQIPWHLLMGALLPKDERMSTGGNDQRCTSGVVEYVAKTYFRNYPMIIIF